MLTQDGMLVVSVAIQMFLIGALVLAAARLVFPTDPASRHGVCLAGLLLCATSVVVTPLAAGMGMSTLDLELLPAATDLVAVEHLEGVPDAGTEATRAVPPSETGTREIADRLDRPYLVVDLDRPPTHDEVRGWFRIHRVQVLNVAGPRETGRPGIQAAASDYLHDLLAVTWP